MIEWLAEHAGAVSLVSGFLAIGGYVWRYLFLGGKQLPLQIHNMVVFGVAGSSLPVSLFLVWMGFQPDLIPQMAAAFERFSGQLFIYGAVSFFVIGYSLWQKWPRRRDDD